MLAEKRALFYSLAIATCKPHKALQLLEQAHDTTAL